jgi:hypothetical protein
MHFKPISPTVAAGLIDKTFKIRFLWWHWLFNESPFSKRTGSGQVTSYTNAAVSAGIVSY